jgi:hypothetical protein
VVAVPASSTISTVRGWSLRAPEIGERRGDRGGADPDFLELGGSPPSAGRSDHGPARPPHHLAAPAEGEGLAGAGVAADDAEAIAASGESPNHPLLLWPERRPARFGQHPLQVSSRDHRESRSLPLYRGLDDLALGGKQGAGGVAGALRAELGEPLGSLGRVEPNQLRRGGYQLGAALDLIDIGAVRQPLADRADDLLLGCRGRLADDALALAQRAGDAD